MFNYKVLHRPGLRQREWIFVGAVLNIVRLPAPSPVAVGIVFKCVAVFIHETITIIILSFQSEKFILTFFVRANLDHSSWISRIDTQPAIGIFAAHKDDLLIIVKIIIS